MKTPPELDKIADVVLAYKPKPKTKAAKRRARRNKRAARPHVRGCVGGHALDCRCWCHKVTRWTVERRARQLLEAWMAGMNRGAHYFSMDDVQQQFQIALEAARKEFRTMPHSQRAS